MSDLLSNVTWNAEGTSVISATALVTRWLLRMSPDNASMSAWEDTFTNALIDNTGYGVIKTNSQKCC